MSKNRPVTACLIASVIVLISCVCRAESPSSQPTSAPSAASRPVTNGVPSTAPSTQPTTKPTGLLTRDEAPKPLVTRDASDTTWLMLQMLASILIVFVLGAAAFFVVRKLLPRLSRATGRDLSVQETVYLGPRKSLHLVQVGRRRFLVAASRERISMLAEVSDTDTGADADMNIDSLGDSAAPESPGGREQ